MKTKHEAPTVNAEPNTVAISAISDRLVKLDDRQSVSDAAGRIKSEFNLSDEDAELFAKAYDVFQKAIKIASEKAQLFEKDKSAYSLNFVGGDRGEGEYWVSADTDFLVPTKEHEGYSSSPFFKYSYRYFDVFSSKAHMVYVAILIWPLRAANIDGIIDTKYFRFLSPKNENFDISYELFDLDKGIRIEFKEDGIINRNNAAQPTAPDEVDDLGLKKPFRKKIDEKPRWAEENRPTKTLSVRVSPQLKRSIDAAVQRSGGLDRMTWIREAIDRQLGGGSDEPAEFPDYKSVDKINVRLDPDVIDEIDAKRGNVPRTEWIKRVAYWAALAGPVPAIDNQL